VDCVPVVETVARIPASAGLVGDVVEARMMGQDALTRKPPVGMEAPWKRNDAPWALVLAGGEGVRLRELTRQICGEERPKQYVPLLGARSLLQQTVDRLLPLIPPERTVVVTMRTHARYLARALGDLRLPRILAQPADRGTAAAILLGAQWILGRDPGATVIVLPSDHLIVEEALFMGHLTTVARFVQEHPEWMVLLGAQPMEPEIEYGWIEAGPRAGWTANGPVYRVLRFWGKPSRETASMLLVKGCLWNTFMLVAGVGTLIAAGRECVPALADRVGRLSAFFGTEHESWAMSQAYALAPRANFSRSVLQRCPGALAVSKLPALTWCDLGSPDRVVRTLTRLGIPAPWLSDLSHPRASA
jgi:mannose-1-phosphate guanylyltransferase